MLNATGAPDSAAQREELDRDETQSDETQRDRAQEGRAQYKMAQKPQRKHAKSFHLLLTRAGGERLTTVGRDCLLERSSENYPRCTSDQKPGPNIQKPSLL